MYRTELLVYTGQDRERAGKHQLCTERTDGRSSFIITARNRETYLEMKNIIFEKVIHFAKGMW